MKISKNKILRNRLATLENELELARADVKTEKTNIIIREVCIDIWNIFISEKVGYNTSSKPDFAYMSKAFFDEWKRSGCQSRHMTRIGVQEHRMPMAILRKLLIAARSTDALLEILRKNLQVVWITKAEDRLLAQQGLRQSIPDDGSDRYNNVGIIVHPEPIKFKNLKQVYQNSGEWL